MGKVVSLLGDDDNSDACGDDPGHDVCAVKPEDCGFIVSREHPEYVIYELEGQIFNWTLLVSTNANAEDMLGELFNHMISSGIIALYMNYADVHAARSTMKGTLH